MENACPRPGLKAFFLVGPTATGKTAVTQWIAEHNAFDILSADAMLVYRDMNIGTAKPDQTFRSKVRYWGLDLVSALDQFSAGMYRAYAVRVIKEVVSAGRQIIVTGGTGLYIKSLTHGLHRLPAGMAAVRAEADRLMQQGGISALQEWARTQAPQLYESLVDKTNPRRLVRAVETASVSSAREKNAWRRMGKGPRLAGLLMPMAQLHERIKLRVKTMYSGDLLDEVDRLLRQGFPAGDGPACAPGRPSFARRSGLREGGSAPAKLGGGENSPPACKAIGYAEAIAFLRGKVALDEAMEITIKRTRQLAKRQMTWFRHQADVEWLAIDSGMPTEQIARMVLDCWGKIGPTAIVG